MSRALKIAGAVIILVILTVAIVSCAINWNGGGIDEPTEYTEETTSTRGEVSEPEVKDNTEQEEPSTSYREKTLIDTGGLPLESVIE